VPAVLSAFLPALLPLIGAILAAWLPGRAAAACAVAATLAALAGVAVAALRLGGSALVPEPWVAGPIPAASLPLDYHLDTLTVLASVAACGAALATFLLRLWTPPGEGEEQLEVWGLTILGGVLTAVWAGSLPLVALGWGVAWFGAAMLAARAPGYPEGAGGALIATGGVLALMLVAAALRLAASRDSWVLPWASLTLAGMAALGAFPFQAWSRSGLGGLVQGHVAGTLSLALGPYLLARGLARIPLETAWPAELLLLAAAICLAVGALDSLRARHFRGLLASTTLVQAGFVLLGFGVRSPQAATGALLLSLTAPPALVVMAYAGAWIERQQGALGPPTGAAAELRRAGFLYAGAALTLAGAPAAAGPFLAKWEIVTAAIESGGAVIAGLGIVAGSLLTAALAQLAAQSLLGDWRYRRLVDLDARQIATGLVLMAPVALSGLLPWLLLRSLAQPAAAIATGMPPAFWAMGIGGNASREGLPIAMAGLALLTLAAALAIGYVYEGVGDLLDAFLRQRRRTAAVWTRRPTRANLWLDIADSGAWLAGAWRAIVQLARGVNALSQAAGQRYYLIVIILTAVLMLFLWRT
jgi:formate hydrogenlyase subunit 3/multisubunit Na+/H+ antiporter MnhD subunit